MYSLLGSCRELFVKYLKPQLTKVAILAILLFTDIFLQIFNPQLLKIFLDAIISYGPVLGIAVLFIGIALVQQFLAILATYLSERISWIATNGLRADLALHLVRQDLSFHASHTPGELIERVDGDATVLANFFSQFIIQMVGNVLLLAGIIIILCIEDWRVGFAFTIFALLMLITMNRLCNVAVPHWKSFRQASADLFGFLEERITGTEDIRANGAQTYVMNRFFAYAAERLRMGRRANLMSAIPWGLPGIFYVLGNLIAFVLATILYRAGSLTIGTAFLIYYYTQLLFQPILSISNQFGDFQKAAAGIMRIQELLQMPHKLENGPGVTFPPGPLSVAFEDVVFGYREEEIILHNLSFGVEAGEVLGLLGRTGSGKTTVARLLSRLYDPTSGKIYLGGQELRRSRLADLRSRVGIVTQDVQLFRATVRDNLTFFDKNIDDTSIVQVFRDLGLMPWFTRLPDGLDTMLSASGGGLSAGESQLLAFARVFLRNPGIIILDEASSRLDPASEFLVEQAIDKLLAGRTGIIIAHRLHTIQRADTIMIMEAGRICEYGARTTLAADVNSRFSNSLRAAQEGMLV